MSGARGYEALLGLGEETVWGTAVAATEQFLMQSESFNETSEPLPDDAISGRPSRSFERPGPIRAGGTLTGKLRYPDANTTKPALLLKHHFGQEFGILFRNVKNISWFKLRESATIAVEVAQQVTLGGTGTRLIAPVKILMRRRGALTSGNVNVEINADSAGDPGAPITDGTSVAVAVNTITLDDFGQWIEFTFAAAPSSTGGTILHVTVTGTYTESAVDNIEVGVESGTTGGGFETFNATVWSDDTTRNMNARFYTSSIADAFPYATKLTGLGLTSAIDKGVGGIDEFSGQKVGTLTLRGDPDAGVVISSDFIGKERNGSPVNTSAILKGLQTLRPPVGFTDLNFRLGIQTTALGVPEELSITEFEFRPSWELDQINTSGGRKIIEPENTHRTIDFSFTLPRLENSAIRDFAKAGTKLQARLYFTDGTNNFTLLIPEFLLQPSVDDPVSGANPLTVVARGRCYRNTSNSLMRVEDEAEVVLQNVAQ